MGRGGVVGGAGLLRRSSSNRILIGAYFGRFLSHYSCWRTQMLLRKMAELAKIGNTICQNIMGCRGSVLSRRDD